MRNASRVSPDLGSLSEPMCRNSDRTATLVRTFACASTSFTVLQLVRDDGDQIVAIVPVEPEVNAEHAELACTTDPVRGQAGEAATGHVPGSM